MALSRRFFPGFPWRYVVTNLQTETVTWLEGLATNRSLTFRLNQPAECRGQVPSDDPRVNITDVETGLDAPHLSYADRLLYAFRREQENPDVWVCRFGGPIMQIEDTAQAEQPYSTFTAFDPWQYLFHRALKSTTGLIVGTGGLSYNNTRRNEIVRQLLEHTIEVDGDCFIDYTASGGNLTFGTFEECDPVDINFQQGTSIGDCLRQLVALGGIDVEFAPTYDPAKPGVCATVNVYRQKGDVQDGALFAWDINAAVGGISSLVDGDQMANVVQFYNGQGGDPVTPSEDATSQARYGIYEAQQFFPGQIDPAAVEGFSDLQLDLRKNGRRSVTLNPNPLLSPKPFIDYSLGDKVPVYATTRLRQALPWEDATTVYQRVYGIPITLGDDGVERVERLVASPDGFS